MQVPQQNDSQCKCPLQVWNDEICYLAANWLCEPKTKQNKTEFYKTECKPRLFLVGEWEGFFFFFNFFCLFFCYCFSFFSFFFDLGRFLFKWAHYIKCTFLKWSYESQDLKTKLSYKVNLNSPMSQTL